MTPEEQKIDRVHTWMVAGTVVFFVVFFILLIGPSKILKSASDAASNTCGDDYLVIKTNNNGDTVKYWELRNKRVYDYGSYIIFPDDIGNSVTLKDGYFYLRVANWEMTKAHYINC